MYLRPHSFSLMLLVLTTILMILEPIITAQTPATSPAQSWSQNLGQWSNKISPSENSSPVASYFLCGFQFERTNWQRWEPNCDCGRRWYRWRKTWRCRGCHQIENTMATSFKGVFCHYNNWNNQKEYIVDAQAAKNGLSTLIMCPIGQYAYAANGGLGTYGAINTGFGGLQLKCSKIDISARSQVSDNLGNAVWGQYSATKIGDFISGFSVRYEQKSKLTGFQIWQSPAPVISNVEIKYKISQQPSWAPTVVDTQVVSNNGQTTAIQTVSFNRKFEQQFTWKTSHSTVRTFQIKSNINVKFPHFKADLSTSYYTSSSSSFEFDKQITNSWSSDRNIVVLIPPKKIITVQQVFYQSTLDVPFEARVTYTNRLTGQLISIQTIQGVWTGLAVQKSTTVIKQADISQKP